MGSRVWAWYVRMCESFPSAKRRPSEGPEPSETSVMPRARLESSASRVGSSGDVKIGRDCLRGDLSFRVGRRMSHSRRILQRSQVKFSECYKGSHPSNDPLLMRENGFPEIWVRLVTLLATFFPFGPGLELISSCARGILITGNKVSPSVVSRFSPTRKSNTRMFPSRPPVHMTSLC